MKEKMWDVLELVLKNLEFKSKLAEITRDQILVLRGNPEKAKETLIRFNTEANLNNCTRCDSRHFNSLFLACIYNELDIIVETQSYAKKAIRDFYLVGCEWNQILARWTYGMTYLLMGRQMPARKELEITIEMLETMAKRFRHNHNYEKRNTCKDFILKIREVMPLPSKGNHKSPPKNEPYINNNEIGNSGEENYYLVFPWIPIYEEVQAGANGTIWLDFPAPKHTEMSVFSIDEIPYHIHSLKQVAKKIILQQNKSYAWARVKGHSMNNIKHISIENGDYILFYKAPTAQEQDIVVASYSYLGDGVESQYMVKRYKQNKLYSETTLQSNENKYDPIDVAHCQILGIVIAVAKPI